MKKNIFDQQLLGEFLAQHKIEKFRSRQIYQEIFRNQQIDFADMTTLGKELRERLADEFEVVPLMMDKALEDEQTTKFGFSTRDGKVIEAVLMYHWSKHHE